MERIKSVDALRVLAIVGVIMIHTRPFFTGEEAKSIFDPGLVLDQLARFAVPFFFVVSGYFWSAKIERQGEVFQLSFAMCRRIAQIFIFWTGVYIVERALRKIGSIYSSFPGAIVQDILYLAARPITTAMEGSKSHLWFLPALLSCVAIAAAFVMRRWERALLGFAIVLFAIGLCGAAYSASPLGFTKNFNFRNGPFFGLLFFVMGRRLFHAGPRPSWLGIGAVLVVLGTVVQFAELALIHHYWGTTLVQNFVIGTGFTGLGMSMMALSNDTRLRCEKAARIGPLVLGIYASHHLFVDVIGERHQWTGWYVFNEGLYVLVVFALAVLTTYVLSRNRVTRQFVA